MSASRSVATGAAVPPATFTGTIIDTECARDGHAAMRMGPTDAECARVCVMALVESMAEAE